MYASKVNLFQKIFVNAVAARLYSSRLNYKFYYTADVMLVAALEITTFV